MKAVDHIEALINLAKVKGEYARFPERFDTKPDIGRGVGYHCNKLDNLGVPFDIQNEALMLINDADSTAAWKGLMGSSHRKMATETLAGGSKVCAESIDNRLVQPALAPLM